MSQKTDKMLKLALVFFISLLSFSIGTFVGKKYSDNQHKLSALEPQKTVDPTTHDFASTSEAKPSATAEPADSLLTDTEVAKIAEEFATDDTDVNAMGKSIPTADSEAKDIKSIPANVKATTQSKPSAKTTSPVAPAAQTKTATAKMPLMPNAETIKAEPKPLALKADKTKNSDTVREVASIPPNLGQYTVQVGSFPTQMEAQKLTQDLLNKGYKSSFVAAQINGQTWHRVNVGLFGTVKEAQDYKKDFLDKTKLTSAIVQRVK